MRLVESAIVLQRNGNNGFSDALLSGLSLTPRLADLCAWAQNTPNLHDFPIDYHRLQVERWVWDNRERLGERVMDVGVEIRRDWLGQGYFTFGERACDVVGDVESLPQPNDSIDGIVCTEVLEHVRDPWQAVRELYRVLRPGGLLLATSPFAWPWHGRDEYQDYWRFTHQGWALLLGAFADVKIHPCMWTQEGLALLDLARRFEAWGFRDETLFCTGYLCEGVKR